MAKKMHASSHKPPRMKPRGAREAASEAVGKMLSEAEQKRHTEEMAARRRETLDELEEDARNLAEYARDKMERMGEMLRETAEATREATGLPPLTAGTEKDEKTPVTVDAMKDTLQAASDKLGEELGDISQRVESVKARVTESMQAAGGRAAEPWHQSSEAAKNVGEREYCMPLPTERVCARHVVFVGLPLAILFVLWLLQRRYPKKWEAGMKKVKQPRLMLAREPPTASEKVQATAKDVSDSMGAMLEEKTAPAKRQGLAMFGEGKRKAVAAAEKAKREAESAVDEGFKKYEGKKNQ